MNSGNTIYPAVNRFKFLELLLVIKMSLERVKLCVVLVFLIIGPYLGKCQKPETGSSKTTGSRKTTGQNDAFEFHSEEQFCIASAKLPFYQRDTDGAVCCRGKQLPVIQVAPEISGDCAIKTTTGSDGILESESLVIKQTSIIMT
jgi:hypothetical protein